MRQYKSRFLKTKIRGYMEDKKESQDGIIHSVDTSNRWTGIKIQGSDNLIRAYYPENWEEVPFWCKVGNCVRISYCGGNRGRTEILGMGILRPTPMIDSTAGDPVDTVVLEDAILSGLDVMEIPYGCHMKVMITVGEARFNGNTATSGAIKMGSTADGATSFKIGMGGYMGQVKAIKNINSAPGTAYVRMDLISMASDLVVDYTAGTAFHNTQTTASIPSTGTSHLLLNDILVPSCTTCIDNYNITGNWTPSQLSMINIELSDTDLSWSQTAATVVVHLNDQYQNIYRDIGAIVQLSIESGQGIIANGTNQSTYAITQRLGNATGATFQFIRHMATSGSNADQSPILKALLLSNTYLSDYEYLTLRDSGGTILTS